MAFEHGKMDIADQQKTFHGFIKTGIYLGVIVAIILVILMIFGV